MRQNYSMKWFKFLAYVGLIVGAIENVLSGVFVAFLFSGWGQTGDYLQNKELVRILGTILAIVWILVGIFTIIIRKKFIKYKANGPTLYYLKIAVVSVMPLLAFGILKLNLGKTNNHFINAVIIAIVYIVISMVYLVLNRIYFKKRAELFVN